MSILTAHTSLRPVMTLIVYVSISIIGVDMMEHLKRFGPKAGNHPSIGTWCPACKIAFKEGDYTALVPLGPGSNSEAQERCRRGQPYNAVAVEIHYSCATGEE